MSLLQKQLDLTLRNRYFHWFDFEKNAEANLNILLLHGLLSANLKQYQVFYWYFKCSLKQITPTLLHQFNPIDKLPPPPPTCTTKWKDFREDIWPGTEVGGRTNIAYVFLSSPDHVDDTLPVHVQYATFHESLQLLSVFRIEPKLLYLSGRRMVSQLFIRAKLTKFHEIIMPRFGWLTVLPFNTPWNCWDCLLSLSLVITNWLND